MSEAPKKESILLAKWQLLLLASTDADVTKADMAVLGYVLNCINSRTKIAFPALTTIATSARIDRATAIRSIRRLEEFDYLRKKSGDRRHANEYRMGEGRCVDAPTEGRCVDAPTEGRCVDAPTEGRCVDAPTEGRCVDAPTEGRCVDATTVGASKSLRVGAGMRPQSGKRESNNRIQKRAHTHHPHADEQKDSSRSRAKTFNEWVKSIPQGKLCIESDDEVFSYADKVNMHVDYLQLAWRYFRNRFSKSDDKQVDWKAWFRRSVEENWSHAWRCQDGEFSLTTRGEQLKAAFESETQRTLNVW